MGQPNPKQYTKILETQPRMLTRADLIKLAATIKSGLPPHNTLFYEVYAATLQDGRKIAGDGLDELFLDDELNDMPKELHVWIAGVDEGKQNDVEIYFTQLYTRLKVRGYNSAWVKAECQQIVVLLNELAAVAS